MTKLNSDLVASFLTDSKRGIVLDDVDPSDLEWLHEMVKEEVATSLPEFEADDDKKSHEVEPVQQLRNVSRVSPPQKQWTSSIFDTNESSFVGQIRAGLAHHYGITKETLAPHDAWGKNVPLLTTCQSQLLYALDMVQWTLEQMALNQDEGVAILLSHSYKFSLQIAYEQLLTTEYIVRNPDEIQLTHDLRYMMKELNLKDTLQWCKKKSYGTNEYRYPSSFKLPRTSIQISEIEEDMKEFIAVLKSLHLPVDIVAKGHVSGTIERDSQFDTECKMMIQQFESIKSHFSSYLQNLAGNDIATIKKRKAFLNCEYHLNNMSLLPLLIMQCPQQRYLHNHFREALFSTQYFLENLGVALSLHAGKEMRTHDLTTYCTSFGLGKGLTKEELSLIQAVNAKKSSEYPYLCSQQVQGLISLSNHYCRSRNATIAGEGFISHSIKEKSLTEIQKENLQFIQTLNKLIQKLITIHLCSP